MSSVVDDSHAAKFERASWDEHPNVKVCCHGGVWSRLHSDEIGFTRRQDEKSSQAVHYEVVNSMFRASEMVHYSPIASHLHIEAASAPLRASPCRANKLMMEEFTPLRHPSSLGTSQA